MKRKRLLLKISFILLLIVAALHTFFILIGGPPMPETKELIQMQELMKSEQIDSGGGIFRTMQNFTTGFNIIVSIFLISLPVLSLIMLAELRDNEKAIRKLTVVNLMAVFAFFLTSLTLLAIGGTVVSGLSCILLTVSLFVKSK